MKKQAKLIEHFNNQKANTLNEVKGGIPGATQQQRQVGTAPASYRIWTSDTSRVVIRFTGDTTL